MAKITIYTSMLCGYCHAAKGLLTAKGAEFEEIDVSFSPAKRAEMRERSGGRNSVPQIWIGDTHVGGCDDLNALDRAGKLEALIAGG